MLKKNTTKFIQEFREFKNQEWIPSEHLVGYVLGRTVLSKEKTLSIKYWRLRRVRNEDVKKPKKGSGRDR